MQKNIYAIMTAAMAASFVTMSSCSTDDTLGEPVVQFTGTGVNKDTFAYNTAITGSITIEADALKSVKLEGPNSRNGATWFKELARFEASKGDPVYSEGGKKYKINIEPNKQVQGGFWSGIAGLFGGDDGAYSLPDTFPAGKYTLVVNDDNKKTAYAEFVVLPSRTGGGNEEGDFITPYNDSVPRLLALVATNPHYAYAWDELGMDTIIAAGDYFYKQGEGDAYTYGMLRVRTLTATSATLSLFTLVTNSAENIYRLDSVLKPIATIGTGSSIPSYYTNEGEAKLISALGDGTKTFVAMPSRGNVLIEKAKMVVPTGTNQQYADAITDAKGVVFINVATALRMSEWVR